MVDPTFFLKGIAIGQESLMSHLGIIRTPKTPIITLKNLDKTKNKKTKRHILPWPGPGPGQARRWPCEFHQGRPELGSRDSGMENREYRGRVSGM